MTFLTIIKASPYLVVDYTNGFASDAKQCNYLPLDFNHAIADIGYYAIM